MPTTLKFSYSFRRVEHWKVAQMVRQILHFISSINYYGKIVQSMTCCDLLDSHSITADEADFPIQGETLLNHLVVTLKIFTYKWMINIFCKILIVLQEKYMTSSEYFDSLRPWPGMCNIRSMWSSATVTVGDRASKSMITVHWQPSRYLHNKIKWYF